MKKKINAVTLMVLTLLTVGVMVTGCSKDPDPAPNNEIVENDPIVEIKEEEEIEKEDEAIDPIEDASDKDFHLSVDPENVFTYAIVPAEDTIYQTGMPYTVERLNEAGEWENVELDMVFTMQIVIVEKENPFYQTIDLSEMDPGTYRISKSILNEAGEVIDGLGSMEAVVVEVGK